MHVLRRGSPEYRPVDGSPGGDYDRRHGTRGLSPEWNEPKRKRSLSPADRYVRPRYDDSYYGRDRHGERARSPDRRGPRNAPQDPAMRDTLVSFKQYSDWFKFAHPELLHEDVGTSLPDGVTSDKKDISIVKMRYDEYRRNFIRKQYQYMFEYHRKHAWFIEKYDSGDRYADMRTRVRQQGWRGAISHFIDRMEAGNFDPSLHEDIGTSVPRTRVDEDETMDDQGQTVSDLPSLPTKKAGPGEVMVAPAFPQLMIRTIPPDVGRLQLEEILVTLQGFKHVAIGDPVQKRAFNRVGWIAFDSQADVDAAVHALESKRISNMRLMVTPTSEPFVGKIRYTPPAASKLSRMEKDLEQAKRLAAILEAQAAEVAAYKPLFPVGAPLSSEPPSGEVSIVPVDATAEPGDLDVSRGTKAVEERIEKLVCEVLDTDEDGNPDYAKKVALSLDIYLAYLREAFHCCYYCVVVADHAEELIRKCIKHERREDVQQENSAQQEPQSHEYSEDRWAENLDHKLACLLDQSGVDPAEYGGTRLEDERPRMTAEHISKQEEGKWRCQICTKLFKASEFVEKHVVNKHPEIIKPKMDEWKLFNSFVLDPQHILPMSSVPVNATGYTSLPPQAYGLPPDWRPPYGDPSRFDSRSGRDSRDRDRRSMHTGRGPYRRSPSPTAFPPPIRFTMDTNNSAGEGNGTLVLPIGIGLPAKPVDAVSAMSRSAPSSSSLIGRLSGAPLPPPPGVKPDPRSRVSYRDLDQVESSEDVALQY